jgi:hypothetical protein
MVKNQQHLLFLIKDHADDYGKVMKETADTMGGQSSMHPHFIVYGWDFSAMRNSIVMLPMENISDKKTAGEMAKHCFTGNLFPKFVFIQFSGSTAGLDFRKNPCSFGAAVDWGDEALLFFWEVFENSLTNHGTAQDNQDRGAEENRAPEA